MERGFTLLELVVVVIIIGILATLGFATYGRMIEKGRKAEAMIVLGTLRSMIAGIAMEHGGSVYNPDGSDAINNAIVGIGPGFDQIPGNATGCGTEDDCRSTNYFRYCVYTRAPAGGPNATIRAVRCGVNGKGGDNPFAGGALSHTIDFSTGQDPAAGFTNEDYLT